MKRKVNFTTAFLLVMLVVLTGMVESPAFANRYSAKRTHLDSIRLLLSRLDLSAPGLEKVKAAESNPEQAARELLAYYRSRMSVKHPVDRQTKTAVQGQYATEKEITTADNALEHILVGQPAYPPHFCGEDIDWSTQPVKDKEWVWQLNRMTFWSAMAHTYWHTGEEKYAQEWSKQLLDWVMDNPRDAQHDYAWRSIEAGIRGYQWTGLFQHFIDAPSFTPPYLLLAR